MADINSNIRASKKALKSQLSEIARESNDQRLASIGGLANDLNFTMTETVTNRLLSIFRFNMKFRLIMQTLK